MEIQPQVVQTQNNFQSEARGFSIKQSAHAFNLLSKEMYTRPIEAVVREVLCNATDAHVAAGNTDPVKVTIPTPASTDFVVSDEGCGMSFPDLERLMTTYFDSTKQGTNEQIGGFGIGSKAPFAYTETFNIRARWEGKERVYIAYKGADGPVMQQMGVEVENPDVHNGIRVSFPVRDNDTEKFARAYAKVAFFLPKGSVSPAPKFHYTDLEEVIPNVWITPKDSDLFSQSVPGGDNTTHINMGGVGYSLPQNFTHNLFRIGVRVITVPIGTFTPHPSREVISPDDNTEILLKRLCDETIKTLCAEHIQVMDNETSVFKVAFAAKKYRDITGRYYVDPNSNVTIQAPHCVVTPLRDIMQLDLDPGGSLDINKVYIQTESRKKLVHQEYDSCYAQSERKLIICARATTATAVIAHNDLNHDKHVTVFARIVNDLGVTVSLKKDDVPKVELLAKALVQEQLGLDDDEIVLYSTLPRPARETNHDGRLVEYAERKPVMLKDLVTGDNIEVGDEDKCAYIITRNHKSEDEGITDIEAIQRALGTPQIRAKFTEMFPDYKLVLVPTSVSKRFLKRSGTSVRLYHLYKQMFDACKDKIVSSLKARANETIINNLKEEENFDFFEKYLDIPDLNPYIKSEWSRDICDFATRGIGVALSAFCDINIKADTILCNTVRLGSEKLGWWNEQAYWMANITPAVQGAYVGYYHDPVIRQKRYDDKEKRVAFVQVAVDKELTALVPKFNEWKRQQASKG